MSKRRQLTKNTIEILIVSISFYMLMCVPATVIHESVHFVILMYDENVYNIEMHVFDNQTSVYSPGHVSYQLRDVDKGLAVSVDMNEGIAYTASLTLLCICMWVFITRYVKWRGDSFVYNKEVKVE